VIQMEPFTNWLPHSRPSKNRSGAKPN
jgi:hypothetical protein